MTEDFMNSEETGHFPNPQNDNVDLSCFQNSRWVTGDAINEYGNILKTQFIARAHVFSTYFLSSLKNRGVENLKGLTRNVNIFEKENVYFPIHENSHWYLIIFAIQEKTLNILDPYLPLENMKVSNKYQGEFVEAKRQEQLKIDEQHMKKAKVILNEYILKLDECPEDLSIETQVMRNIPKQKNYHDCGVFLLAFMKYTVLKEDFNFQTKDMPFLRKVLAKEILDKMIGHDVSLHKETEEDHQQEKKLKNKQRTWKRKKL